MELVWKLLDHPFYRQWTHGAITTDQLAKYHTSYLEFIEAVPDLWRKVVRELGQDQPLGLEIIREEEEHIALWKEWGRKYGDHSNAPSMKPMTDAFFAMDASMLLGALHAFESQQPEVARTKKAGLLSHYGHSESELSYFDEHMKEEKHIRFGEWMSENRADRKRFQEGFAIGSAIVYSSLDAFLN